MTSRAEHSGKAPVGQPVLRCQGLQKVFQTHRRDPGMRGLLRSFVARETIEVPALRGIDLSIEAGEFVGLIGANGAGKTTLVKVLTGIVPATQGRSELFGEPSFELSDAAKSRLSIVMGQRSQLWWDLAPLDSFLLLREIYRVEKSDFDLRLEQLARRLAVTEQLRIPLRHLSLGQRMRMEILGAFLHRPQLVFLDEPTIGLDLVSREEIRTILSEINREQGATIVLSSHDMEDIENTCRRLLILSEGRLLYDGDLVKLRERLFEKRAIELHLEPHAAEPDPAVLAELCGADVQLLRSSAGALSFAVPAARVQPFLAQVFARLAVRDLAIERTPLDVLVRELFQREGEG